jgi:hypothetical protein
VSPGASLRRQLADLRALVESLEPPVPLDLARLSPAERVWWDHLVARFAAGPAARDAAARLRTLTDDELWWWERCRCALRGEPVPSDAITYGAFTTPPPGHPQWIKPEGYGPGHQVPGRALTSADCLPTGPATPGPKGP